MNGRKGIQFVTLSGRLRRGGTARTPGAWATRVRGRVAFLTIVLVVAPAAKAETN